MMRSVLSFTGVIVVTAALASPMPDTATAGGQAASPGRVIAQMGSGNGPSYGYQPYNDRNPTGFFHPQGNGYGQYYMPPKLHGHRFKALDHRRFRGY